MYCISCKRALKSDDIGIYKKLINKGATEFECKACLSKRLKVEESEIDRKIEFYRKHGCTLFN